MTALLASLALLLIVILALAFGIGSGYVVMCLVLRLMDRRPRSQHTPAVPARASGD